MDLSEIESTPEKPDFRRANGAPMVVIDGKNERFSRASSYVKPLDDESALTNWRINKAIAGVAGDKALQARAVAAADDDRSEWAKLRDDTIAAGRGAQAADIGTAIHAMSERWEDPDDDFDPPSPYREHLEAYSAEMKRLSLESVLFEFQTVNVEYRAAGTADRLYKLTKPLATPDGKTLPAGTLVIGDLKTSKSLEYSMAGFAGQLAIYAQGQRYNPVLDEFIETPDINQDWGIIAWVPSDREEGYCEMVWVDLQAGNQAAWLAFEVKEHRKTWRKAEIAKVEPAPDSTLAMLREVLPHTEINRRQWCLERIEQIKTNEKATKYMLRKWPKDLPTPKTGWADEDLQQVDDLLGEIEREHQLPFITPTKETQVQT